MERNDPHVRGRPHRDRVGCTGVDVRLSSRAPAAGLGVCVLGALLMTHIDVLWVELVAHHVRLSSLRSMRHHSTSSAETVETDRIYSRSIRKADSFVRKVWNCSEINRKSQTFQP